MRFSEASSSSPNSVLSRSIARSLAPPRAHAWSRRARGRARRLVAVPERHLPGLPRRRRDDHAVERDVLDPPRAGAEHEHLAAAALVHPLLIELADATAVGRERSEEPAVGDRARGRDRDPPRTRARGAGRSSGPTIRGRSSENPSAGYLPLSRSRTLWSSSSPRSEKWPRDGRPARGPRATTRPSRTSRRAAARERRAGCAVAPLLVTSSIRRRRPSLPTDRRGTSGRPCRVARRPGGRRGRSAGAHG